MSLSAITMNRGFMMRQERFLLKDGTIMFMGKKWPAGCPEEMTVTVVSYHL